MNDLGGIVIPLQQGQVTKNGAINPPFEFEKHGIGVGDIEAEFDQPPPSQPPPPNSGWGEPGELDAELPAVIPLTPDMLPEPVRAWLMDISGRMKCPLDYCASAFIVMVSSLIGTRLAIKPKQRDDWTIICNLWGAAIGDPSMMKTPSIAEVFKPLRRIMDAKRVEHEQEQAAYLAAESTREVQKKVFQSQEADRMKGKKVDNPVSYPGKSAKPTERRYMVNDATIEKLGPLLNENPTGLMVFLDELVGLFASWEKPGRESDRAFYLEAWNGSNSKTIDRVMSGTLYVDLVCLALYGGIQPSKLMGYLQAATEYQNDGFVQRLQLAVYPDKPVWGYTDEYPDKEARDLAFGIIDAVAAGDFSQIAYDASDYERFPFTRFNAEAQQVFKDWITDWKTNVEPNETGLVLEHFAKYPSLMPSLALVFHVVNHADGQTEPDAATGKHLVGVRAARMAVRWCEYLASHAKRIYGMLDKRDEAAAKELLKHLKRGDLKDGFKRHDVVRKGWAMLGSKVDADNAIELLVTQNWLKAVKPAPNDTGRPEAETYLIHPKISPKA